MSSQTRLEVLRLVLEHYGKSSIDEVVKYAQELTFFVCDADFYNHYADKKLIELGIVDETIIKELREKVG